MKLSPAGWVEDDREHGETVLYDQRTDDYMIDSLNRLNKPRWCEDVSMDGERVSWSLVTAVVEVFVVVVLATNTDQGKINS